MPTVSPKRGCSPVEGNPDVPGQPSAGGQQGRHHGHVPKLGARPRGQQQGHGRGDAATRAGAGVAVPSAPNGVGSSSHHGSLLPPTLAGFPRAASPGRPGFSIQSSKQTAGIWGGEKGKVSNQAGAGGRAGSPLLAPKGLKKQRQQKRACDRKNTRAPRASAPAARRFPSRHAPLLGKCRLFSIYNCKLFHAVRSLIKGREGERERRRRPKGNIYTREESPASPAPN